jgi:hypothetical protein
VILQQPAAHRRSNLFTCRRRAAGLPLSNPFRIRTVDCFISQIRGAADLAGRCRRLSQAVQLLSRPRRWYDLVAAATHELGRLRRGCANAFG